MPQYQGLDVKETPPPPQTQLTLVELETLAILTAQAIRETEMAAVMHPSHLKPMSSLLGKLELMTEAERRRLAGY